MFTCVIRYEVEGDRLGEFESYAEAWIELIERYGGTHHGYFVPCSEEDDVPNPTFSFSGLGREADLNIGYALFSFPDVASYDRYREEVARDPECAAATARFNSAPCFTSYERSFLKPIFGKRD